MLLDSPNTHPVLLSMESVGISCFGISVGFSCFHLKNWFYVPLKLGSNWVFPQIAKATPTRLLKSMPKLSHLSITSNFCFMVSGGELISNYQCSKVCPLEFDTSVNIVWYSWFLHIFPTKSRSSEHFESCYVLKTVDRRLKNGQFPGFCDILNVLVSNWNLN